MRTLLVICLIVHVAQSGPPTWNSPIDREFTLNSTVDTACDFITNLDITTGDGGLPTIALTVQSPDGGFERNVNNRGYFVQCDLATIRNGSDTLYSVTLRATQANTEYSEITLNITVVGLTPDVADCSTPPEIQHGKVTVDGVITTVGAVATVSCEGGYETTTANITCPDAGTWLTPTCTLKDCSTPPVIQHGTVTVDSAITTVGAVATVSCEGGYETTMETITCPDAGTWPTPTCTLKDCSTPPEIQHGTVTVDGAITTVGAVATVSCEGGYETTTATITCPDAGTWPTSTCTLKDCSTPTTIQNGIVTSDSGITTVGAIATVTCDDGYETTTASITCPDTGTWLTPMCILKDNTTLILGLGLGATSSLLLLMISIGVIWFCAKRKLTTQVIGHRSRNNWEQRFSKNDWQDGHHNEHRHQHSQRHYDNSRYNDDRGYNDNRGYSDDVSPSGDYYNLQLNRMANGRRNY